MTRIYLIGFYTIIRKEICRFARLWIQVFLPNIITTGLYLLIFGSVIGQHIGLIHGVAYNVYIIPGLVMLAMINAAFSGSAFSLFSSKFQGTFDEILVSPLPTSIILAAYIAVGMLRGLISAALVTVVAYFFTGFHFHSFWLSFIIVLTTSAAFSALGLINAIWGNSFEQLSVVPNFILTPLIYLGGVFYSVHALPDIWHHISLANPIFYIINGFRYAMLDTPTHFLLPSIAITLIMTITFLSIAGMMFHTRFGLKR